MALTKPVFSGSSTADVQAYKQQLLDYYVQSGDTSPTVVSDIKYGNLNYGNINKAGTLEYSLFNPVATAKTATGLTEANQIFSSATGKQLTGDGLVAVEGALRQGYSAADALKNLGDLGNYAKFSTDYNGGTSGGPAGPGGADLSGTSGFWEASPEVTTPKQAATVTPEQRATMANTALGVSSSTTQTSNPLAAYAGGNPTTGSIVDYLRSVGQPIDYASRAKLAAQAGIQGYQGTAAQNTQLLNILRGTTQVPDALVKKLDYTSGGTVSADSIAKAPTPTTGVGVIANTGNNGLDSILNVTLGGLDAALLKFFSQQQETAASELVLAEKRNTDLTKSYTDLNNVSSVDELNKTMETYKIKEKMDAISSIKEQILKKQQALNLGIQQENDRIAPLSVIGRRQQVLKDQVAGELSALAVTAQVLQDDLSTAQYFAQMSFDALQADNAKKISAYQFLLQANKQDIISLKEDQKDAINGQIETIKGVMKTAEENKDKLFELISENSIAASKAGVSLTDDIDTAYKKMLPYISEQAKIKQDYDNASMLLDTQYKSAQIRNIESEIANRGLQGEGYDPTNILAYAQQYAATGQIPTGIPKNSFGVIAQAAKEIPKQDGALVNSITGIKDSKLGAAEQDDITRLYNITKMTEELARLDSERVGGLVGGTLGKIFGSNDQAAYLTKRKAIVDEIQRMQSGAALTVDEQAFYKDYLPGRFSETFFLGQDSGKRIQNFANEMNAKLENALKNNSLSIYGYSTVDVGGQKYKVGDLIEAGGQKGVVMPDGSISLQQSFSPVGGDTNSATVQKVAAIPDGSKGGQCGRFVNKLTGLGLGDSYESKLAKMDPSIKYPEPGMVFVMNYGGATKANGHTGIILSIDENGVATVKDSNFKGNEIVTTHKVPVSRMTGFRRVNLI